MQTDRPTGPLARALQPFVAFTRWQAAGGVLLLAAAAAAVAWANSPLADGYFGLWGRELTLGLGDASLTKPLLLWVNDGLMAVFFLLVGLEIKRELMGGELSSPRRAALAFAAALGGMVVPALLYAAFNAGGPGERGWGIPMATDIAFALGVLALLGSRAPLALKVFLTAVAIVDDLGAVLVIALFYTSQVSLAALAAAAGALAVLWAMNRAGIRRLPPYALVGFVLWVAVLKSGVHATVAGVLLAMAIPVAARAGEAKSPLARLEHALHPWVAFAILPVFALANAGVALGAGASAALASGVTAGVVLGLVVGKQVGVLAFAWLAVRLGIAELPRGIGWGHIHAAACLCGIGFTMSLFIGGLAFGDPALLDQAKVGILAASLLSGVLGAALLALRAAPAPALAPARVPLARARVPARETA